MDFFYSRDINNRIIKLSNEESYHCIKVLRHRKGDKVGIVDGLGNLYVSIIENADTHECILSVEETIYEYKKPTFFLHLCVSPTKNHDRMEWLIEKATEIGLHEFTPIITQNTERAHININRLEKKAVSAIKQSQKAILPKINQPCDYQTMIQEVAGNAFIAHCNDSDLFKSSRQSFYKLCPVGSQVICFIGPEGDFSYNEIEWAIKNGIQSISLGPNRLRTETAALMACQIVYIKNNLMD